ncbi:hypothetical protein [Streptomyces sp. NBC_01643]|uniref:hypothetical protein n=1 Tax=unclassified Streptomyces TaxID=2593676 RepID=UPI00386F0655|nr:hypothetical protein OHB03_05620 [Streptomyces sp. NBC_01643]
MGPLIEAAHKAGRTEQAGEGEPTSEQLRSGVVVMSGDHTLADREQDTGTVQNILTVLAERHPKVKGMHS